jgi:prepilin-type N-terminal cleavage/methylation domain-containing protein
MRPVPLLKRLAPASAPRGFTLVELLIVVAVVGILAAVAIPQFAAHKKRSIDAQMQSDLHHARSAMEAFYVSNDYRYTGATLDDLAQFGFRGSPDSTLCIELANETDYTVRSCAAGGSFRSFVFSTTGSASGRIVGEDTDCSC